MKPKHPFLTVLLICATGLASIAHAQTPAPAQPPPVPDGPRYVVTYLEVRPWASAITAGAARKFRDEMRKAPGNLRAEALQRFRQMNQLVLLTVWKDQAAVDAYAKAAAGTRFVEEVKKVLVAPVDERVHFALSVGPLDGKVTASAIAVVTHVDVIPPQRENGTGIIKQLAERSRQEGGNMRFEAVTQTNRQNHFSLIEMWRDHKTADEHVAVGHVRAFREKLAPMSGALYDERYYRLLP